MDSQKLHFFAPIGNVDNSILKMNLKQGFKINSKSKDDGETLISQLENFPIENIYSWRHWHTVFTQDRLFCIEKSFEFDLEKNEKGDLVYNHQLYEFITPLVDENITVPLRLLRLFKEGNIHLPCWYIYTLKNGIPSIILASPVEPQLFQGLYHLDDSEIKKVQEFLDTTKMPLNHDYLTLAHRNFELSYTVHNSSLSFLSLMIASEVLFNPGSGEITHQISRNFAVLLGNSVEDSKRIQNEIKELYKRRSLLVHNGKEIWNFIGDDDNEISKIRNYVRESIKRIILMDLSKKDLRDLLNSKGFGWKDA